MIVRLRLLIATNGCSPTSSSALRALASVCFGRENKGSKITPADWDTIRAVRAAVRVPVLANGNIHRC
jgi:tRNA-dihydrouridine synthase